MPTDKEVANLISKEPVLTPKSIGGRPVTSAKERSPWLNIMFYAESGWGKTTLGGSAQAVDGMSPVLMIDAEEGSEALRNSYPGVEIVTVTNVKETMDIYSELFDLSSRGECPWKTVLLDPINEEQKFSMNSIMERVVIEHPERDVEVPSKREYLINLEQMRRMIRAFRDLKMHTIFTCLAESYRDDMTGKTENGPLLTGKFKKEVAALVDVICYGYTKEVGVGEDMEMKRLLLTSRTDTTVAKDRTGKLPMVMESPTMSEIYKLLKKDSKNG